MSFDAVLYDTLNMKSMFNEFSEGHENVLGKHSNYPNNIRLITLRSQEHLISALQAFPNLRM